MHHLPTSRGRGEGYVTMFVNWEDERLMCERRDSCVIKPWSWNIAELSLHCSISLWTNSSSLACVCF